MDFSCAHRVADECNQIGRDLSELIEGGKDARLVPTHESPVLVDELRYRLASERLRRVHHAVLQNTASVSIAA